MVFIEYVDTVRKEMKMKLRRLEARFSEEGRELRLAGFLNLVDLLI